jgi:hypothetical protein
MKQEDKNIAPSENIFDGSTTIFLLLARKIVHAMHKKEFERGNNLKCKKKKSQQNSQCTTVRRVSAST